jgi:hypothetical protein
LWTCALCDWAGADAHFVVTALPPRCGKETMRACLEPGTCHLDTAADTGMDEETGLGELSRQAGPPAGLSFAGTSGDGPARRSARDRQRGDL